MANRKYDLMIMVKAQLSQSEKESLFKQAEAAVTKGEGKINQSKIWIDKHMLDFKIQKCSEVTYYLIEFESTPGAVEKIKQTLKLNEDILRFMIVNMENSR